MAPGRRVGAAPPPAQGQVVLNAASAKRAGWRWSANRQQALPRASSTACAGAKRSSRSCGSTPNSAWATSTGNTPCQRADTGRPTDQWVRLAARPGQRSVQQPPARRAALAGFDRADVHALKPRQTQRRGGKMIELLRGVQRQPNTVSPHHRAERMLTAGWAGAISTLARHQRRAQASRSGQAVKSALTWQVRRFLASQRFGWFAWLSQFCDEYPGYACKTRRVRALATRKIITVQGMQRRHRAT